MNGINERYTVNNCNLMTDVFCVGKDRCKKLKWEKTCEILCPCMDYGGCWVHSLVASEKKDKHHNSKKRNGK